MKNRLISLILVIMMVLGTSLSANAKYFPDVSKEIDSEIFDAINYMSDNGYMVGNGNENFQVDASVTRGMLTYLLFVYSNITGNYTNSFTDVGVNSYYYNAVGWAQQNKIINGTTETTFSPQKLLTRQDLFVILYNYATKYLGKSYSINVNLGNYVESSTLLNYVKVPIQWAINYKIYVPQNNRLANKETVTRGLLALYVHKFELNINKIQFTEDVFAFNNSDDHFIDESYYISNSDYGQINNFIKNYYTYIPSSIKKDITDAKNRDWSGSCYGMTIVTALDKFGIIGFNENFATNKKTMRLVESPSNNPNLRSMINAYHVSQHIDYIENEVIWYDFSTNNDNEGLMDLIDAVREHQYAMFYFNWKTFDEQENKEIIVGHVVLAYDYEVHPGNNAIVYAYDSNNPDNPIEIVINASATSCVVGDYDIDICFAGIRYNFDSYRYFFDMDGRYNNKNITYEQSNVSSNDNNLNNVELVVPCYTDYLITNSSGSSISVNDGIVSGSMNVKSKKTIPVSVDEVSEQKYIVDNSNSFSLSSEYSYNQLEIYGNGYNIAVTATGASLITVNNNGQIVLSGTGGDFSASYIANGEIIDIINLEGVSTGNTTLTFSDSGVIVSGVSGDILISYTDYDNNTETSSTVESTDGGAVIAYSIN